MGASLPKSVLVVDDDVDIRETLKDALEDEGYVVRCVANGVEGLIALRNFARPHVVLLDLVMPLMDGNEMYLEVQKDPTLASIPVVISTSDPSRAPSGVPVLRKPVNLASLLSTLAQFC